MSMRDNPFEETATLEVAERPAPRPAPEVRAVRDPLLPESPFRRFGRALFAGAIGAVLMAVVLFLVVREVPLERIEALVASEQEAAASGPASVPRVDGRVSVRTVPAGALISVNAESAGRTPLLDRSLGIGTHLLSIRMDGFATVDTLVTVRAGDEHDLVLALEPWTGRRVAASEPSSDARNEEQQTISPPVQPSAPAAERVETQEADGDARLGWLTVLSEPAGAVVIADGRRLGRTPLSNLRLEEGAHTLRLTLPDHVPLEHTVTVSQDAPSTVSLALAAQQGQVRVLALPWGSIYIDGELLHEDTDLRHVVQLPAGSHVIRAEHPVLGSVERTVRVIAGESTDVVLDLNG